MLEPIASARLTPDAAAASSPQGLIDRRSLALIAVERTSMPMTISDPRQPGNPIVLANAAFLDLTGYTADEIIGHNCRFLQGAATDPQAIAEIRAAVAAARECHVELRNYRKDGSSFVNLLHISPVHDDDGQLLYFFGSQFDVTLRRQAKDLLDAEHALLREVDHRAKNALALVQGIVRLSNASDAAAYAAAVQGRVDALAAAHALLADERWRAISLERIVRTVFEPHGTRRVVVAGPPVTVEAQHVQPLALVLHETITNAVCFGALSVEDGTVTVEWRIEDGRIIISIVEEGGPAPVMRSLGFGMKMSDAIIQRQLRGKLERDWLPTGLFSRIAIPVA